MPNRGTELADLKASVVKTILARRITLGIFSIVALLVLLFTRIGLNPLLLAPPVWFLLTFPFKVLIERRHSVTSLHWIHACFFIVEAMLITVLVHLMGASEWIGSVFYLFTVIYANFLLPRLQGGLVTGVVVALYAGLVFLEYTGVLANRALFGQIGPAHQDLTHNLVTIFAGVAGVYAVVAFTVRTFAGIYASKNRMLEARERQLALMSRRLLTAQDEERRRIARGLHDELIQSLAAIKLYLSPHRDQLGETAHHEISGIIDRAITETRTLAYSVRPPFLDELGLIPSLKRLAETMERENGPIIRFECDVDYRFDVAIESLFFYVAQQALQNVSQHSNADHVTLTLLQTETRGILSIEDDGVGFRLSEPPGLGLPGIRERVEVSGGSVTITSAPQCGTRITVEVPYGDNQNSHR